MISYVITSVVSFVAGAIVALLFARRNKNKVKEFYRAADAASDAASRIGR